MQWKMLRFYTKFKSNKFVVVNHYLMAKKICDISLYYRFLIQIWQTYIEFLTFAQIYSLVRKESTSKKKIKKSRRSEYVAKPFGYSLVSPSKLCKSAVVRNSFQSFLLVHIYTLRIRYKVRLTYSSFELLYRNMKLDKTKNIFSFYCAVVLEFCVTRLTTNSYK